MERLADWEARLTALITASEQRPLAYGKHDCSLFAADAVLALTGVDVAADLRGRYRTAGGALRALRRAGFRTPPAIATARLGTPVPVLMARRGDLVTDGAALGVMWAAHALFVADEVSAPGLVAVPLRMLTAAWRVG